MQSLISYLPYVLAAIATVAAALAIPFLFRVVVDTNYVHIVQTARKTVSYGKGQEGGNAYYAWPEWVPFIGVSVIDLPMSVFSVKLSDYAGYDKDRVPFVLDLMAFFRIFDSNVAAQRINDFETAIRQLEGIMQGAARSLLGKSDIESILQERGQFGDTFTKLVDDQLHEWGIRSVKAIELMDVRDGKDSHVIHDIMAKKKSEIERLSRVTVADNMRQAEEAEIAAKREVAMRAQEAERSVGVSTAEKDQAIQVANQAAAQAAGVAEQQARQAVEEQRAETARREMAVREVEQVRSAEIAKQNAVITAEAKKQQEIIDAEAAARAVELQAEAQLVSQKRNAEGVLAEGAARAESERLLQMASVTAQTELAREIGGNEGYQAYLVNVKSVEIAGEVGKAQAVALQSAEVKIIATGGDVNKGISSLGEVFSVGGGTKLGGMLEGLLNTAGGKAVIDKLTGKPDA